MVAKGSETAEKIYKVEDYFELEKHSEDRFQTVYRKVGFGERKAD